MRRRRGARRLRVRRLLVGALGATLVWGAFGAFGYIAGWEAHAHRVGARLVESARALDHRVATAASSANATQGTHRHCIVSATGNGQLAGLLEIPAIHLTAPVEEGTTAAGAECRRRARRVLGVARRHRRRGLIGARRQLLVHLGELHAGDRVVYRTACGTAIPDPAHPSIVLDTCYPSNALFFTTQRLLVFADEVATPAPAARRAKTIGVPASDRVAYHVPAPAALAAQGLILRQTSAPMGTISFNGDASPS